LAGGGALAWDGALRGRAVPPRGASPPEPFAATAPPASLPSGGDGGASGKGGGGAGVGSRVGAEMGSRVGAEMGSRVGRRQARLLPGLPGLAIAEGQWTIEHWAIISILTNLLLATALVLLYARRRCPASCCRCLRLVKP
jgi:hypothetical protein